MVSLLFGALGLLCLGTAVVRQRSWSARGRTGVTPVVLPLAGLGAALLLIAPVTQELLSAVLPGAGRLLSNCCTLLAAFAFTEMLGYLRGGGAPRGHRTRRVAGLLAVLAVLVSTFTLGDTPDTPVALFDYRGDLALTVYSSVYALYLGLTLVRMLALAVRLLGRTRRRLRAGMAVITVGCVLGIGYAFGRISGAITAYLGLGVEDRFCGSPFENAHCTMAVGMPALSVLLIVLGLGMPFLTGLPGDLRRWVADVRLGRALRPLWQAMYDALPQIALTSPDAVAGRVPRYDASLRLYRRTVEVRDGALLLQAYRGAADTAEHRRRAERAGLAGERADDAVEAADLAAALERRRSGAPRHTDPPEPSGGGAPAEDPDADDTRAEARRLARVSLAFARRDIEPLTGSGQKGSTAR